MIHPIEAVRTLVGERFLPGAARSCRGLTLVPISGAFGPAPVYRLAAEAIADGTLTVEESSGGEVPRLVVRNPGDLPVLLVEGEHLQGAMQDRVLNVSVLVAARHDTHIPVSCVEHGRWAYQGSHLFAPSPDFAYPSLRALQLRTVASDARSRGGRLSDQGAVWAEVHRMRAQVGAGPSATGAMGDAYRDRGGELDELIAAFERPASDQTGVMVCVAGRPIAVDAFDRPEALSGLWPRLLRGYAMDALGASEAQVVSAEVERFLARVRDAEATSHEGVGLGIDVVLTSNGFVANALVWGDAVVHLAMFTDAEVSERGGPGTIASPTTRARSWFRATGGHRTGA